MNYFFETGSIKNPMRYRKLKLVLNNEWGVIGN